MFTSYIFFSLLKNNACLFTTVTEDKLEDFWKTETTSKWICFSKLSIFFLKLKINFSVTGRIYIQIIIIKYGLMIRLFFMQKRRLFLNIQACQYRGLIKNFGRTSVLFPPLFPILPRRYENSNHLLIRYSWGFSRDFFLHI